MNAVHIVEWGIVLYYFGIVYLASSNLWFVHSRVFRRVDVGQTKISTMKLILLLMVTTGSLYIWLQIDWLLTDGGRSIHERKHVAWMVFEYLIATNGLVTNVLISHQLRTACQKCSVYRALMDVRGTNRIRTRSTDS